MKPVIQLPIIWTRRMEQPVIGLVYDAHDRRAVSIGTIRLLPGKPERWEWTAMGAFGDLGGEAPSSAKAMDALETAVTPFVRGLP